MLERLMDTCKPYRKESGKYNPNALTKLLKNYRSHPALIKVSNELFYENELESVGDEMIHIAMNSDILPNSNFPLIFHNTHGVDRREQNSPSYFNTEEVDVVLTYLNRLMGSKMNGLAINASHIGIISPYKKQVEKIQAACSRIPNTGDLMIGTIEQIQGQERLIIIVSTVRSNSDNLRFDTRFRLGFLKNPKVCCICVHYSAEISIPPNISRR